MGEGAADGGKAVIGSGATTDGAGGDDGCVPPTSPNRDVPLLVTGWQRLS